MLNQNFKTEDLVTEKKSHFEKKEERDQVDREGVVGNEKSVGGSFGNLSELGFGNLTGLDLRRRKVAFRWVLFEKPAWGGAEDGTKDDESWHEVSISGMLKMSIEV